MGRARSWLERLEALEIARGATRAAARRAVSRKAAVAAGTLENLWNRRAKSIAVPVFVRLADCFDREIRHEIKALEHELEMARASRVCARDGEIPTLVAELKRLRSVIEDREGVA